MRHSHRAAAVLVLAVGALRPPVAPTVRSDDAASAALLKEALRRSSTIRDLVAGIETSGF